MDERAVFLRFELFAKRLNKLISMFTTVHQFSSLEQHTHIAGMQASRIPSYALFVLLALHRCTCLRGKKMLSNVLQMCSGPRRQLSS